MDQTIPTQTTQPIAPTANPLANDLLVTQQVDPAQLPQSQVNNDLSALLTAEEKLTESPRSTSLNTPKPKMNIIDPNLPQELQALQLKNPFKGE